MADMDPARMAQDMVARAWAALSAPRVERAGGQRSAKFDGSLRQALLFLRCASLLVSEETVGRLLNRMVVKCNAEAVTRGATYLAAEKAVESIPAPRRSVFAIRQDVLVTGAMAGVLEGHKSGSPALGVNGGVLWRHKRKGDVAEVLRVVVLESNGKVGLEYLHDGVPWVREAQEFFGRFERVMPPAAEEPTVTARGYGGGAVGTCSWCGVGPGETHKPGLPCTGSREKLSELPDAQRGWMTPAAQAVEKYIKDRTPFKAPDAVNAAGRFTCPGCSRSHHRGSVNGSTVYRCLHCGQLTETTPKPPKVVAELPDASAEQLAHYCRHCPEEAVAYLAIRVPRSRDFSVLYVCAKHDVGQTKEVREQAEATGVEWTRVKLPPMPPKNVVPFPEALRTELDGDIPVPPGDAFEDKVVFREVEEDEALACPGFPEGGDTEHYDPAGTSPGDSTNIGTDGKPVCAYCGEDRATHTKVIVEDASSPPAMKAPPEDETVPAPPHTTCSDFDVVQGKCLRDAIAMGEHGRYYCSKHVPGAFKLNVTNPETVPVPRTLHYARPAACPKCSAAMTGQPGEETCTVCASRAPSPFETMAVRAIKASPEYCPACDAVGAHRATCSMLATECIHKVKLGSKCAPCEVERQLAKGAAVPPVLREDAARFVHIDLAVKPDYKGDYAATIARAAQDGHAFGEVDTGVYQTGRCACGWPGGVGVAMKPEWEKHIAEKLKREGEEPEPSVEQLAAWVAKDWKPGMSEAILRLAEGVLAAKKPAEFAGVSGRGWWLLLDTSTNKLPFNERAEVLLRKGGPVGCVKVYGDAAEALAHVQAANGHAEMVPVVMSPAAPDRLSILSPLLEALGWQGGTIHDALAEVRAMRSRVAVLKVSANELPELKVHAGYLEHKLSQATKDLAAANDRVRLVESQLQQVNANREEVAKLWKEARELPATKAYLEWANAGGPNECEHGYAKGIPCPKCDAATTATPLPSSVPAWFGDAITKAQRVDGITKLSEQLETVVLYWALDSHADVVLRMNRGKRSEMGSSLVQIRHSLAYKGLEVWDTNERRGGVLMVEGHVFSIDEMQALEEQIGVKPR